MNKIKIFDAHADIWADIGKQRTDFGETDVFRKRHLEKFRKGGVKGGLFVIWIDPPYDDEDPAFRSEQFVKARKEELADASDIILSVRSFEDFAKAEAEDKLAVVTGLEGASQIGEDLDLFDYYYREADVRNVMLTWNAVNPLATGWIQDPERGLTELGKKAVRRIQDMGMNIDVSHLNDRSFWDVLSVANGPVIASHSNARSLLPLMRNLSDDMMREIAQTGGMIGVNSIRQLVSDDHSTQNLDQLVRHFEHMADVVGLDHIGIGFDFDDYMDQETLAAFIFDGLETPSVDGCSNESEAYHFIDALFKRGYREEEIRKVAYGNFYRLFRDTWKQPV